MQQIEGKVAFITGGASGIGFAMARTFLGAGMKVVMADNSQANLDDAADQLSGVNREYMLLRLDVTDRVAFAAAADEAEARFGKIHLLCNNAGIGMAELMSRAGYADWDQMMNINLGGVINGVVTMLPRIRRHGEGGHIVNTSSHCPMRAASIRPASSQSGGFPNPCGSRLFPTGSVFRRCSRA